MPDILLFGATGYTGSLTADALARRGADFVVCGRDPAKLTRVAQRTGAADARVAAVGDVDALVHALRDVKVLVTCVGPFTDLGRTAVEAAVRAGVHYIDSTGESAFIETMLGEYEVAARAAGVALASAMGFDDVPADVAATLAVEGLSDPELVITHAFPSQASAGTARTMLSVAASEAAWIVDGRKVMVRAGSRVRWAPMPPPLGPRASTSIAFAVGALAPRHLELRRLETYATTGTGARMVLRFGAPVAARVGRLSPVKSLLERLLPTGQGPDPVARARARWTVLAEAWGNDGWRNVVLTGADVYGLTAEFLSEGALRMTEASFDRAGFVAPADTLGIERWQKVFADQDVVVRVFAPA